MPFNQKLARKLVWGVGLAMTVAVFGCRAVAPTLGDPTHAPTNPNRDVPAPSQDPSVRADGTKARLHYTDILSGDEESLFGIQGLSPSIDLANVHLEASASQPGQEVLISGVPTRMGKVRVAILAADGSVQGWGMLRKLEGDDNRIALMTPVLPAGMGPEGDLRLVLFVRGASSRELTLHVNPLPPAPSDSGSEAMLDQIASIIDQDSTSGASSSITPLFHSILDDATNPNSLRAILAGSAPVLNGQQALWNKALIDSVVAKTGVVSALKTYQAQLAMADSALSAGLPTAGYRIQDDSSLPLSDVIRRMQNQATAQRILAEAEVDVHNSVAQASAALQQAGANKDVQACTNILLTAPGAGVLLHSIYKIAYLPSYIELNTPSLHGTLNNKGTGYSSFCNDEGHWKVSGKIMNRAIDISGSTLLSNATLSSSSVIETIAKAIQSLPSDESKNFNFLEGLRFNNGVVSTEPKVWYEGDLTGLCTGTFHNSTSVRPTHGNYYQLLSSAGSPVLSVQTNISGVMPAFKAIKLQLEGPQRKELSFTTAPRTEVFFWGSGGLISDVHHQADTANTFSLEPGEYVANITAPYDGCGGGGPYFCYSVSETRRFLVGCDYTISTQSVPTAPARLASPTTTSKGLTATFSDNGQPGSIGNYLSIDSVSGYALPGSYTVTLDPYGPSKALVQVSNSIRSALDWNPASSVTLKSTPKADYPPFAQSGAGSVTFKAASTVLPPKSMWGTLVITDNTVPAPVPSPAPAPYERAWSFRYGDQPEDISNVITVQSIESNVTRGTPVPLAYTGKYEGFDWHEYYRFTWGSTTVALRITTLGPYTITDPVAGTITFFLKSSLDYIGRPGVVIVN